MEYLIICLVAMLGSGLTLFSGFGLGTILVPVFAIFFPIDLAIVLTAIVHFLNNIFKIVLLGKSANLKITLRFGLPAFFAAFIGAKVLQYVSHVQPLIRYSLFDETFEITWIKIVIASLMIIFALVDLIPRFAKISFNGKYLPLGGVLSGFFGGLSGNQGALRSMFLIRIGLSKEAFIATGVLIACLIDISRLSVYFSNFSKVETNLNYTLLFMATASAFLGAFLGSKLVKKVTYKTVQTIVAMMLLVFSLLLGLGII